MIAENRERRIRPKGSRRRSAIFRFLSDAASGVWRIAGELSRATAFQNQDQVNALFAAVVDRARGKRGSARTGPAASEKGAVRTDSPPSPGARERCGGEAFVGMVVDELDRSLVEAAGYEERLRQISSRVLAVREEERKRIARELHDDTAQALTSVLVRLRVLERSVEDARLRAGLAEIKEMTRETLEGVRRMSVNLRPRLLDHLGLEPALHTHVRDFSQRWPIKATFTGRSLGALPPDVELVLYRVVQEALSNVAKHSDASQVSVCISRDGSVLRTTIEDDGRGFDVRDNRSSRESGLGLIGMHERLSLVGGTLCVESAVGSGTRVLAEIRLPGRGPL